MYLAFTTDASVSAKFNKAGNTSVKEKFSETVSGKALGDLHDSLECSHEDQLQQHGVKNHLQLELLSKFSPEGPRKQTHSSQISITMEISDRYHPCAPKTTESECIERCLFYIASSEQLLLVMQSNIRKLSSWHFFFP